MSTETSNPKTDDRQLKLNGHVGFDTIPDQLVNKAIVQGFTFNILCVGETGLGKSTLMETLFRKSFGFEESSQFTKKVELNSKSFDMKEGNVNLKLTITETVAFGNNINKEEDPNVVLNFIEDQYEKYLQEELKMNRDLEKFHDTRPHLCLYFISPTGLSLKSIDLIALKKLHKRVNVLPIIAKSDMINKAELAVFKQKIMNEIKENDIHIYNFPLDDATVKETNGMNNSHLPFAVVGSNEEIKINGKNTRVRQYPWGTVQVDNEAHCDFVKLRDMILRVNMEDLREKTHFVHYESYRQTRLVEMGFRDDENLSLKEKYERRREIQKSELLRKEEEMRQMFVERVREKEQIINNDEKEFTEKYESLKQKHMESKRNLEERRRLLETEIEAFRKRQKIAAEAQHKQAVSRKKK